MVDNKIMVPRSKKKQTKKNGCKKNAPTKRQNEFKFESNIKSWTVF